MTVTNEAAVKQLRSVSLAYLQAEANHVSSSERIPPGDVRRLKTRALAVLDRLAPAGTAYSEQVAEVMRQDWGDKAKVEELIGIVDALREDYEQDAMQSVLELAHADLFDDFLDMSAELREKGFLVPAAVLAGSVLEEHVRKLAAKHQIAIVDDRGHPKSVEVLSVDLRKAEVFTEAQRKILTGWYGLRSDAAHGHFDKLDDRDIDRMIDSVRDIVVRFPA